MGGDCASVSLNFPLSDGSRFPRMDVFYANRNLLRPPTGKYNHTAMFTCACALRLGITRRVGASAYVELFVENASSHNFENK